MSHVQAARDLVGREEELGAIVGLVDAHEDLPGAVVLSGEAGIGKTTLWLAGIDAAAARGYRILSCRPSEAETGFSFAGLTDLLGNAAGEVLPELPPIQRRALEAALLLGESEIQRRRSRGRRRVPRRAATARRATARSASRSTTSSGWTPRRSRRFGYALARLDDEPVAALAGGPRRRAGLASPRRARGATANGRRRRPERRRDPRAAPRPPRRDVPAADADQALGDLGRQPLLRARACKRAAAQRRHARSRRGAPDSLRPRRAPARARRRPRRCGARGRARRRGARRPDRRRSWKPRVGAVPTPGWPRRSPRGSSSSTESACASRIRCSALRSPHARRPRADGRCTRGWRTSSRPPRNELATSRSRRPSPTARSPRSSRRPRGRRTLAARRRRPPSSPSRRSGSRRREPGRRPSAPAHRSRHAQPRRGHRSGSGPARAGACSGCAGHRACDRPGTAGRRPGKPAARPWRSTARHLSEAEGDDALQADDPPQPRRTDALERRDRARRSSTASSPSAPPRVSATPRSAAARSRRTAHCTSTRDAASPTAEMEEALALERSLPGVAARRTARRGSSALQLCWSADVDRARSSSRRSCERRAGRGTTPRNEAEALW